MSAAGQYTAKGCPWCRGANVWLWDKAVPGKVAVCCANPDCAATGPLATTDGRAVELWNAASRRPVRDASGRLQTLLDELNPPEAERDLGPISRRYT